MPLKLVLKIIKKSLLRKKLIKSSNDEDFYAYFFQEISKKTGIGLQEFYKPTFTKNSLNFTKSFKTSYLQKLAMSEKFMIDCKTLFQKEFFENQRKILTCRLERLFYKLKNHLYKYKNSKQSFESKLVKFLNYSKIQLPCNICQIFNSSKTVHEIFLDQDFKGASDNASAKSD